jgi:16S rRNA (cytidine1402-2'-O)-methyltransferase
MPFSRELNFEGSKPLLYLLATPIGNMKEISPRFLEVVNSLDFVAAEDTRNAGALLAKLNIKKPLLSCHGHNEDEASNKIVELLLSGKKVGYMSDAGYPCVSDPGARLVRKCLSQGIKVSVVNGPSASLDALVASGLNTDHYYFEGFLPAKSSLRDKEIEELKSRKETLIVYEAPHRIQETLKALSSILGSKREACLCRELTKLHEEYIHATLGELANIDPTTLLGEMVIVIEGNIEEEKELSDEEIVAKLASLLKLMPSKSAISTIVKDDGIAKNRVYSLYLANFKK